MPRRSRCEFEGAIQLVTVSGYSGGHVFYDPQIFTRYAENPRGHAPDVEIFENVLWESCEQYDSRIHAYIVEPNAASAIIQTLGAPLSWFVHDLLARFSMHLAEQNRVPPGEKPFPRRYKAQIVEPAKLPYAVRYIHRREIPGDPRRRAINHPFSSNLIYCGRRQRPACFVTSTTRGALAPLGYVGPHAYFEFMARGDSPAIAHMLSQPVIGEKAYAESIRQRYRTSSRASHSRAPSPDEILRQVTSSLLHTEPAVVCSSTHLGALARALVAWYAMRTGAAQIGTVAGWFGVTSSDLRYLIRRHRPKSPQYFCKSLPELFPSLAGRDAVQSPHGWLLLETPPDRPLRLTVPRML